MPVHSFFALIILLSTLSLSFTQSTQEDRDRGEPQRHEDDYGQYEDPGFKTEEEMLLKKEKVEFQYEWTKKMSDYDSPYVYVIPVSYKARQIFYEEITTVPIKVRGAFLLDDENLDKIQFTVKAPNNTVIYSNTSHSAIFDFIADKEGVYEIAFYNAYKNIELKPTFTMNTEQNLILKKEDLNQTELAIDQMITFLKGINVEDRMKRNAQRERYLKLVKTNKYFYTFSILETIILFIISIWQFYYMKHLFEMKGSF